MKQHKRLLAIASSDWHLYDWPQHNEGGRRLDVAYKFLTHIANEASRKSVPILFPGDLYHTPKAIDTVAYQYYNKVFRTLSGMDNVHIYGISGNHDQVEKNTLDHTSASLFLGACEAFPKLFTSVEYKGRVINGKLNVIGIPYMFHNIGFDKLVERSRRYIRSGIPNILLVHTDLWGAKDPSGYEVSNVENVPRNLGKFFQGYDLVLSGHIHRYDKLWDNVYMVGAPYQQRKSDMGCIMGYLRIYDDLSVEFVRYDAPQFKVFDPDKGKPDTNDYWMPLVKAKKRDKEVIKKFNPNKSRKKLAEQYLKVKGIKSKSKRAALIRVLNRVEE
jgi:DNA repair exonuclease SbcCD nuclease subunit